MTKLNLIIIILEMSNNIIILEMSNNENTLAL